MLSVIFRISKASSKLLNLTFGRFIFYKAVYALIKEGKLNLFRYWFTIKLYVLLYIFPFFFFLQYCCLRKYSGEGIVVLVTWFVESLACFHGFVKTSNSIM